MFITSPTPPTRPPRTYNIASPTPPSTRPPPRRYNTASPITPTPPPRRENTTNLITPTQPPRTENTATPAIRFRLPIPDMTASPTIRFRLPIPDITASPTIRFRPPIPDVTASPAMGFRSPLPDVTITPRNQPTLNVSPSPPVEVGKLVLFEVVLWQPPPPGWNLQYRFDFGDGTRTDWTSERQATHTYSSPGNGSYAVHVEIVTTNRDGAQSTKDIDKNVDVIPPPNPTPSATASAPITPSPTPYTPSSPIATAMPTATPFISPTTPPPLPSSKMLWLYIAVGFFGVVALAYLVYPKSKLKAAMAAPLNFIAHSDWDAPQRPPKNVAINYGLYFHSNVSAGQDRLETDGASSILRKKKQ